MSSGGPESSSPTKKINSTRIKKYSLSKLLRDEILVKTKVTPIAAESLGVRSMCTYVETPDLKILLDAGASLGPSRFRCSPHPLEYKALENCRKKIEDAAKNADIVTVSHYHFDHHTPSYLDWVSNWSSPEVAERIYHEKIVYVKSFRKNINFSQRRRGWLFTKTSGKHAAEICVADGNSYSYGETTLKFSCPVFHGPLHSPLGWVLITTIQYRKEKIMFASDVQGPMISSTLKTILNENPTILIVGGPPSYLANLVEKENLESAYKNLTIISEKIPVTIVDHHLLRDENWRLHIKPATFTATEIGNKVVTAAQFLGVENNLLEAQRKKLFKNAPPSSDFTKWMKFPIRKRMLIKPPSKDE